LYNFKAFISKKPSAHLVFFFVGREGNLKMEDYWQLAPTVQSKDLVFNTPKITTAVGQTQLGSGQGASQCKGLAGHVLTSQQSY
jgi:hypothetical protein